MKAMGKFHRLQGYTYLKIIQNFKYREKIEYPQNLRNWEKISFPLRTLSSQNFVKISQHLKFTS